MTNAANLGFHRCVKLSLFAAHAVFPAATAIRSRLGAWCLASLATFFVPHPALCADSPPQASPGALERKDTASIDTTLLCGLWDYGRDPRCSLGHPDADRQIDELRRIDNFPGLGLDLNVRFRFWKDGEIPYAFAGNWSSSRRQIVKDAITRWTQKTNLTFIEKQLADHPARSTRLYIPFIVDRRVPTFNQNFVLFRFKPYREVTAPGRATPGRLEVDYQASALFFKGRRRYFILNGQEDTVGLDMTDLCDYVCALHELGHVIGLLHEHQRWDRDQFLRVHPDVIAGYFKTESREDYAILRAFHNADSTAMQLAGSPYDYTSIMHYPLTHTVPPGIPVTGTKLSTGDFIGTDLSRGDVIGVKRLYNFPLSSATVIDTNPPGLQLIVDGKLVDAPHPVRWRRGTNHTLEAPLVQFNGDRTERYLFGNWGGSGRRSSIPTKIHVTARGEASLWYQANFVVQRRDEGRLGCDPYCRSWIHDESPPNYSRTYSEAEPYWRQEIALWPQAFTFVSGRGSGSREQSFWITNPTDFTFQYEIRNLGRDVLGLDMTVDGETGTGWNWITVRGKETKRIQLNIRDASGYREGSYDARIGVCEIQRDRSGNRKANKTLCLDIPVRFIVVPRSADE